MSAKRPISRPLVLIFAVIFLFETWIFDFVVRPLKWLSEQIPWQRIRRAIKDFINRLPAIFAVLLFGVPVIAMESGSAVAVVFAALGHVVLGVILYGLMKLFGVTLIALIYDLTEEKLMTLAWFVWLHEKFERLHEWARELVEPYREIVRAKMRELRVSFARKLRQWGLDFGSARRRAQDAKTRAVN